MAETKKITRVSKKDQKEILRLHNTGIYTDKEIAEFIGHSEGKVGYWIRKLKGSRRMVRVVKSGKDQKTGAVPAVEQKPLSSTKEYKLTELEKNLHPDTIKILQESKSHDSFVRGYYKKYGFDNVVGIHELIKIWTHRGAICNFEKAKEDERRRKELLAVTGVARNPIKEEPIKGDKRNSFPDIGDQMATLIDRITETKLIMNDILKTQRDTYTLFKEKMNGGKKHDGNTGETATTSAT